MAEQTKLIRLGDFLNDLKKAGISPKFINSLNENHDLFFLFDGEKEKFISEELAKLIFNSARRMGSENLHNIFLSQMRTVSYKQFAHAHDHKIALRESTVFILKNFSGMLANAFKTRIGEFTFHLEQSVDRKMAFELQLFHSKKGPVAKQTINMRFSPQGKPVLVMGNFQGQDNELIKEFEELLQLSSKRKRVFTANFMAETLIANVPKGTKIEFSDPTKLDYMFPERTAVRSGIARRKGIKDLQLVSDEEVDQAMQEIPIRGLGLHKRLYESLGFELKKGRNMDLFLPQKRIKKIKARRIKI